jgi:formylmethanofuran dehydrogenase subunit C
VTLTLTLREQPAAALETEGLCPDRLAGASRGEIEGLTAWHGTERTRLGDFFAVSGSGDDVRIEGDLGRVKFVGAGMSAGRLTVAGDVGMHAGAGMSGGELHVEGDAGDWAGAGMRGGRLVVRGSAGRQLGGVYPGERAGMRGCAAARSSPWCPRCRWRPSSSRTSTARRSSRCTCAGCGRSAST